MKLKDISFNIALVEFEKELERKEENELKNKFKEFINNLKKSLSKRGMKVTSPEKVNISFEIESKYFSYLVTPLGIMGRQKYEKIEDEIRLIKAFEKEFKLIIEKVMQELTSKHCAIRIKLKFSGNFVEFINKFIKNKKINLNEIKSNLDVIGVSIEKDKHKWKALISKDELNLMLSFSCEEGKDNVSRGLNLEDLSIIKIIQDVKKLLSLI